MYIFDPAALAVFSEGTIYYQTKLHECFCDKVVFHHRKGKL